MEWSLLGGGGGGGQRSDKATRERERLEQTQEAMCSHVSNAGGCGGGFFIIILKFNLQLWQPFICSWGMLAWTCLFKCVGERAIPQWQKIHVPA